MPAINKMCSFSLGAIVLVFFNFLVCFESAFACSLIDGLADINGDGRVTVVVLGDSIPYGFGDTVNGDKGGYVLRAGNSLPRVKFINDAVAGERTFELIDRLENAFSASSSGQLVSDLLIADLVVLDEGRNDRWLFGLPLATYRNLKRVRTIIENQVSKQTGIRPLVVTAVLMLPNRGSQGPWVKELNSILLQRGSPKAPADLRFDLVSKRLLSEDQIHPTSKGYAALAKVFIKYVSKSFTKHAKALQQGTCAPASVS